jgi:steroid 5-alpha reductase family enzyme
MSCWFLIALWRKRNDVADVAWGLSFALVGWVTLLRNHTSTSTVQWLVTILVTIWAIRLSAHIYLRNRGKTEDKRYAAWRADWGKWFLPRSYLQVFLLQGALLLLISMPVIFINSLPTPSISPVWLVAGSLIWLLGFYFESVGDWQLTQFLKNPASRGKLMTSGLWAYTRHPNYFGEVTQWWGLWIIACGATSGWMTILGPITITFLILKISGIPMLERSMQKHPDWQTYATATPKFFPKLSSRASQEEA